MSQWLGSLQIHEFNQTANRLKEQQKQSISSSSDAARASSSPVSESQPARGKEVSGNNTTASLLAVDSEPLADSVVTGVSDKLGVDQPGLKSEVITAPFVTDDSEQTAKANSEDLSLEQSNGDTVEQTNTTDTCDTNKDQVSGDNAKDYVQTKIAPS